MPWPNLTPQEIAAYQMMAQPNPALGQAQQGLAPQMYMQLMGQPQGMGQTQQNPGMMQQPTMANMLMRPQGTAPNVPQFNPTGGNMSTILNNPQLMQLLMQHYGGGTGM